MAALAVQPLGEEVNLIPQLFGGAQYPRPGVGRDAAVVAQRPGHHCPGHLIGVIVSRISDPFRSTLLDALLNEIQRQGFQALVSEIHSEQDLAQTLRRFAQFRVSGGDARSPGNILGGDAGFAWVHRRYVSSVGVGRGSVKVNPSRETNKPGHG